MQTIKTASICVLMMTVLYGAYVSMTTPPDPLPPGVESMIAEDGGLDLSDDFAQFDLDAGQIEAGTIDDFAGPTNQNLASNMDAPEQLLGNPSGSVSITPADRTLPDSPTNFDAIQQVQADSTTDADVNFQMSDLAESQPTTASTGITRLPMVAEGTSTPVSVDPTTNYPSTDSDFELPEPDVAVAMATSEKQTASSEPSSNVVAAGLANAIETADRQFLQDRKREALATLSLFYETPNLNASQREELLIRLDPLARDVIYSPDHLLEEPHRVAGNETLIKIAEQYDVPWQLLANINGIDDPVTVLPGTDLKVVRGPFRADVDLANQELTLFLGDLYAGRFPVGVGSDPKPEPGTYQIQEKQSAKTYYDLSGNPVPPGNPRNPYGSMWIDLGGGMSLHGSPQDNAPTEDGCVSIAGNYARDVFGILSEGSEVTIR